MQDFVRGLIELQRLDTEKQRLGEKLQALARTLLSDEKHLEEARASLRGLQADIKELQIEVDRRNLLLEAEDENIRKLESQKMELKTNVAYAAMQNQIQERRQESRALEDHILEAMETVEKAKVGLAERIQAVEASESRLGQAQERAAREQERIGGELKSLEERWQGVAGGLGGDLVQTYVRTRDHCQGIGLAQLSPDCKCQACFMTVRLQLLNEVLGGKVVTCPNCSRLLYSPS